MAKSSSKSPKNPDEAALRDHGMSFPEVTEDFPWGHRALKVRGKAFVFMGTGADGGASDDRFFITCKLPESGQMALSLAGVEPTGYGLGKSGWVSARYEPKRAPVAMLREWITESYRAVAPKTLARLVGEPAAAERGARPKTATKKKSAAGETTKKSAAGKTTKKSAAGKTTKKAALVQRSSKKKASPKRR